MFSSKATVGEVVGVKMSNANAVDLEIGVTGASYTAVGQTNAGLINVVDLQPLIFGTNNTERMRISETGNVGIGTTNPTATLDVDGSAIFNESGNSVDFRVEGLGESNLLFVDGSADRIGIGTASPTAELDINGNFNLTASTTESRSIQIGNGRSGNGNSHIDLVGDATYTDYGLRVQRNTAGANGSSNIYNRGTGILSLTAIDAGSVRIQTNTTTRMTVTSAGLVEIAMTNPSVELDVTGDIEYTGTITDVSDRRLKENFSSIDSVLTKIMKIEGLSYNMIADSIKTREYGVIAQDVQAVFPEMVKVVDLENGYLGVSYIQLVPVLLEATKAQQAIIEAQKQEIASEKAENESQKQEIETIKAGASSAKIISTETAQKLAALEEKLNALLLLNSKSAVLTAEN